MADSLELREMDGRLVARVDPCPTRQGELQYRDVAAEYGMGNGDGYFALIENGVCIQKYEIPL